jgi:Mor family transcriptional regulator
MKAPTNEQEAISYLQRQVKNGVKMTFLAEKYELSYDIVTNVVSKRSKKLKKWRNIVRSENSFELS